MKEGLHGKITSSWLVDPNSTGVKNLLNLGICHDFKAVSSGKFVLGTFHSILRRMAYFAPPPNTIRVKHFRITMDQPFI